MGIQDNLIVEKLPNSSTNYSSIKKITYAYDSMNRRVARTDEKGTTQYLYGNPNHPFQLTAVRSTSGNLSRYHYDDFGLLFALERDNNWYYITTDQLGTPRVVCDANGQLVKVLEYNSFGHPIADSNPAFELHITFAGSLADSETELVRFGFRDYDSASGKWTAKDPIGFASDDGNLYRYVVNSPIHFKDPTGEYLVAPALVGLSIAALRVLPQVGRMVGAIGLAGGATYIIRGIIPTQRNSHVKTSGSTCAVPSGPDNNSDDDKKKKKSEEEKEKAKAIEKGNYQLFLKYIQEMAAAKKAEYEFLLKATREWWKWLMEKP